MQTIQNLKETLFSDCRTLIQKLNESENAEALITEQGALFQLMEKVSLLKNLDSITKNIEGERHSNLEKSNAEKIETENYIQRLKEEYWKTLEEKENQIAELTSQIKLSADRQMVATNIEDDLEEIRPKLPLEDFFVSQENSEEEKPENITTEIKEDTILPILETEKENEVSGKNDEAEKEENRRKIVEFDRKDEISVEKEPVFNDFKHETHAEKKFRLGKIKGLSVVKSLFDDDFSDLSETVIEKKTPLQSRNMDAKLMEAEKPKLDFRIDLNDKVAFTKLLFKGDEAYLRATINQLNSYKTLQEAKEYLSELYYENGWQKVDDYAQRLWALVENKFN
ncbi:hypothetical protein SAMN05421847_1664 [Halpernia humi]|uniref:Uncharacterized protein n=1 Tax=Halpernia humi TaxID=493375 RepID=A0A1H5Y481_9FLAO|nr:hypothetical protein [Halpernia humi]SEG18642.1 hypothetical protein SAMN05421847_1664 [Halpernia humi]